MNRKLIKEIKGFEKEVEFYKKNVAKFKKKFPKADIYTHLSSKLTNSIFVRKHSNTIEFFRTDRIFSQDSQANPLIELEKWSTHSWSCASLTKITVKEFFNYYVEVDEEYIKDEIAKKKTFEINALKELQKDTLSKYRKFASLGESEK